MDFSDFYADTFRDHEKFTRKKELSSGLKTRTNKFPDRKKSHVHVARPRHNIGIGLDSVYSDPVTLNGALYTDEELELRTLLTECLNRGEINDDGLIVKARLRMALRTKIKRKETKLLDAGELGPTLSRLQYLMDYRHDRTMFKIDLLKLPPKKVKPVEVLKEPMVITGFHVDEFKKNNEMAVPGSEFCLFCKVFPAVKLSDHMRSSHKRIVLEKFRNAKQAIIKISHEIDPNCAWVKFFLKNLTYTDLQVKSFNLVCAPSMKSVWKVDEFIDLGPDEKLEFKLSRSTFTSNGNYLFVIYAERTSANYMQVNGLEVNRTLYDLVKEKRALKEAQAELEWLTKAFRFRKLEDHLPDEGLLKLFSAEFTVKGAIDDLTLTEFNRYKQLVDFKKNGCILTENNYKEILKLLVEIEDLYVNHSLYRFNIPKAEITEDKLMYSIDISKVVDFPDCIEEGDFIVLKACLEDTKYGEEIVDPVIKIANERVYFEIESDQTLDLKRNYFVRFRKDRTCIQMEQDALQNLQSYTINRILFPTTYNMNATNSYTFTWFNEEVGRNPEQQQAVRNIVRGSSFPAPYIIFGPPGTGKTATIVETICQIWRHKSDAKILVTAPTNAACDEIATRLLKYLAADDLYRYYSASIQRRSHDLEAEVEMISNYSNGKYKHLSMKLVTKYRIILCTLIQAGRLDLNGCEKNYFNYIFLDECGSATEPSSLVPIVGLTSFTELGANTNIVIAGDPKQLGPIVTSDFANIIGLGRSLLERLMDSDFYLPTDGKYNEEVITKLLLNFRSHAGLLSVPSLLFYGGELVAKGASSITNFALKWPLLPNPDLPLIFHGVDGDTKMNSNSFSIYNNEELGLVVRYVEEIVNNGINGKRIPLSEIGVVSPYALQVQMIKSRLRDRGWKDIQVGSAERYQGKEKMVMILSTVRSNTKTAGFLGNPKRLNVVITRAKGLLVVIGNPKTLRLDENWFKFLEYCKEHNTTKGEPFELKKSEAAGSVDANGNSVECYEEKIIDSLDSLVNSFEQLLIHKFKDH